MVLTEIRKIYRVSIKKLAEDIGVSKQLIGQIEKGNRTISNSTLNRLAEDIKTEENILINHYITI